MTGWRLDARWQVLEAELANARLPAPRLHPNLAEVYRQRVAQLAEVLVEDDNAEARDVVRGLVETIRLEHAAFEKKRDSQIDRFSDSSSKLGIGGQQGCDLIPTRLDTDTRP